MMIADHRSLTDLILDHVGRAVNEPYSAYL